jgi:hypothetical protein
VSTRELTNEQRDNISDGLGELRQRWNNRLVLPFTKLPERYLGGELRIHCHISSTRNVACKLCVLVDFPYHVSIKAQVESRINESQLPMLICSVHLMNDKKGIIERIRSFVRLQTLDQCFGSFADSLYLSIVSGKFMFLSCDSLGVFPVDRELNMDFIGDTQRLGRKLKGEMIERCSKMVNNFSSQNAKPERDFPVDVFTSELQERLIVVLYPDRCGAIVEPNVDFPIEIDDILIGPF